MCVSECVYYIAYVSFSILIIIIVCSIHWTADELRNEVFNQNYAAIITLYRSERFRNMIYQCFPSCNWVSRCIKHSWLAKWFFRRSRNGIFGRKNCISHVTLMTAQTLSVETKKKNRYRVKNAESNKSNTTLIYISLYNWRFWAEKLV